MPRKPKHPVTLHLAGSGQGLLPTLDDLAALSQALTGRAPTAAELAKAQAVLDDTETDAERALRQLVADEESGRVTPTCPDPPPCVPIPAAPGDVVAVTVPEGPRLVIDLQEADRGRPHWLTPAR